MHPARETHLATEPASLDLGHAVALLAAAVVLKPGRQADVAELQEWVKQHLRSSRVPQLIQFWPTLPYNETGKLLRRIVKADLSRAVD